MNTLRFAFAFAIICVALATSPAVTISPPAPLPPARCTPKWWRCGSNSQCCHGWRCSYTTAFIGRGQTTDFIGRRCEPPPSCIPTGMGCESREQCCSSSSCGISSDPKERKLGRICIPMLLGGLSSNVCVNCANFGCPPQCLQSTCVSKWARCSSSSKPCCSGWRCSIPRDPNFKGRRCEPPICTPRWWRCGSAAPCCDGWQCVRPKNSPHKGYRILRCEPPPPKCVPKWWHCRSPSTRCCNGWRCVRPARPNGFRGLRCEPPPKCTPKWWPCKGSNTRCCGGWRCIRSPNPKFQGFRCEP